MKTFSYNLVLLWVLFLVISLIFLLPLPASGQAESITISKSPQFPAPHQTVVVSLTSRLVNINDKQTTWRQDGEIIKSGVGIKRVVVDVGAAGETTTVTLQTSTESEPVEKSIKITPRAVDMIWEAENSYTPPFYRGKALHPGWGDVRVTAIPHIYRENGSRINRNELVYTWEYNRLVYGNDSGRGQSSFSVGAVPRQDNRVTVEIEKPNGDLVARKSVTLPIVDPELVLYQHDPLLGTILSTDLGNEYRLQDGNEVTVKAVPYFYLTNTPTASNLEYDWKMNRQSVTPSKFKDVVTFRRPDGVDGQANVTLEVDDTSRLFPSVDTRLEIIF